MAIHRRYYRLLAILFTLAMLSLGWAPPSASAQGLLDPFDVLDASFGYYGIVTTDFGGHELGESLALQQDGKIIVAGSSNRYDSENRSHYDFALSRYNTNGSLDTTFDTDGRITLDLGGQEQAYDVALQPDGKIVVAGNSYMDFSSNFVLLRYNTDGSLDTTFSDDGKVVTNIIYGSAVAIQTDGKILVAGSWYNGVKSGFGLVRLNSNGSLDTTFDGDGSTNTYFTNSASGGELAIQPDGKIVVIGYSYIGSSSYDFALARYNSNGSLDTTFDSDGKLTVDFGSNETTSGVVIQPDGRIVVVGTRSNNTGGVDHDIVLARYDNNGTPDSTFDMDGQVIFRLGLGDIGTDVTLQPDGRILMLGSTAHGSPSMTLDYDFALLRFNGDGSLDTTFDTDGKIVLDLSIYDPADEIALQPDGKIILSGGTLNSVTRDDFALVRLQVIEKTLTIAGNAGIAGVTLSYTVGTSRTVTSQPNGNYSFTVPSGWNGTVTPTHPCFTFSPVNRTFSSVSTDQTTQDFTPTFVPMSGCSDMSVSINGGNQARFGLEPGTSTRTNFSGINNGPVKITSTNSTSLLAAERLIYKFNGVNTSFTEMMGLPDSQLDNTYWLPWYNNVDLDTQLRFANVSNSPATVTITIGGQPMGDPIQMASGASTRISFPGVNAGPVKIVSTQNIVAAERLIYKVNGKNTSFSEMMALPNKMLDTTYWLPWYNNKDLDTQLRFANVSSAPAQVHVYIGGVEMQGSPFNLLAGESTRKSFPGINNGPVEIVSDQNIVAAERLIYKVNNINTSFTEMMALPNSQLDTTYWLPWYNNKDLDTQLRFANVHDTQTATVHVLIGGVEMPNSPFTLLPGESTRQSFTGVNIGPVKIVSDAPIVAAERLIYKVNNVATSLSEMMALPDRQLDTIYWLPWYNNVDLDTQLRFGIP